ncbi:cytochrome P450 [uncultured Jatrophihabitans sp.]|uniref:cytochrome P450 n=1 Tax=uncultured Jatrophihabitans sp. TaxID=1610747 RepID=UPI0035CA46B7
MPEPSVEQLCAPDVHVLLADLRARRPVCWLPAVRAWLVTRHDLAVEVMRDPAAYTVDDPRFSTARVIGPSMLSVDGVAHRSHRTPFVGPFRPRQVHDRYGALIERLALDLVRRMRAGDRRAADVRTQFAGPLSVTVLAAVLGVRDVDAATVLGWYGRLVDAVQAISAGAPAPPEAAWAAMAELGEHLRSGLRDPGESVLRDAAATLDEAAIVGNAAVMMFGGIETTEGMLTNALAQILARPGEAARLAGDGQAVPAAVEESLRLEPAAGAVDRYATRDVSLGGALIAAGDLVRVSLTAANRDPAVFEHPDDYDPSRPNLRAQLAFATGPHVFIAMDLARLETVIALRVLLAELPGLRLRAPAPARGLIFRKPAAVEVAWAS